MKKQEMLDLLLDGQTYQYIANKAGISRQRVQQILAPPRAVREYVLKRYGARCNDCGILVGISGHLHHINHGHDAENYDDIGNLMLLCISCHRLRHADTPKYLCLHCGTSIRRGIFCSRVCWSAHKKVSLLCNTCGAEFEIRRRDATHRQTHSKTGLTFCSHKCWGVFVGKHYGRKRGTSRYTPLFPEMRRRLEGGESMYSTLKGVGLNESYYYLRKLLYGKANGTKTH